MSRVRFGVLAVVMLSIVTACANANDPVALPEPTELQPADALSSPTAPDALASRDQNVRSSPPSSTVPLVTSVPQFDYGPSAHDLSWLADQAALAILEQLPPGARSIDLDGKPVLADRIAIGLEALGAPFTRSSTVDSSGYPGTQLTLHESPAVALSTWPFLESNDDAEAVMVRREAIAAMTGGDLTHNTDESILGPEAWLIAESAPPQLLATELTESSRDVVAWSNREAQRYTARNVTLANNEIRLSAQSRTSPANPNALPYDSGMVLSVDDVGWSTITADVQLPTNDGLWPAIWLLSADACEGAGRCSGYQSNAYYEIDLLEVAGDDPSTAHTTVHWWDEVQRSSTATTTFTTNRQSNVRKIQLERRPGMLIWWIDGVIAHVVTERVDSFDSGPHQSGPMMLIVNHAVGGTFAGSLEIGRDGGWLGEALVPSTYPEVLDATFTVSNLGVREH